MTSGEFTSLLLDSITVDRDRRIRRELKPEDVTSRAESISRLGLIHPIVVTRERVLIAGETRLEACRSLGWDTIPVQYADTLTEHDALAIELEENVKRKDLPWQDQCDALRRFHELKAAGNPGWTQAKTAEAIGLSPSSVADQLSVAKELASGNARVVDQREYSVARGIVKRQAERRATDAKASIVAAIAPEAPPPTSPILNENFTEWVTTYSGEPFNFIHCDFPYGINADKFNQGAADALGGYEDTPGVYWNLVETLVQNRSKLLGESGHVLFWFSFKHYSETLLRLREHFWVDPYPVIWFKSDNKGTLPDPQRGPRRVYEAAFVCSYGDRKILSAVANTFAAPTVRLGEHMSEKSQPMLQHFFRMFVDGETRLLDPTCGSGSALRAARALGCRSVLGLELNPDFAENARRAWNG